MSLVLRCTLYLAEVKTGTHRGHYLVDVPSIRLSVSGRLNPHQGVEPRSVETSLELGKVNVQLDVLQRLLKRMKARRRAHENILRAVGMSRPPLSGSSIMNGHRSDGNESPAPTSAASQTSKTWRSPLSPTSPFMGALSVRPVYHVGDLVQQLTMFLQGIYAMALGGKAISRSPKACSPSSCMYCSGTYRVCTKCPLCRNV